MQHRLILTILASTVFFFPNITNTTIYYQKAPKKPEIVEIQALITGYNTVIEQTDDTPCISASGENICGLENTVACPRFIPFYTIIRIYGEEYVCLDRLHEKYDDRFDINCDKDFDCPEKVFGTTTVEILQAFSLSTD